MQNNADVREAAGAALLLIFEQLLSFALDAGLSVSEVGWLLRRGAVAAAKRRQGEKINISSIAAITGIPRATVASLLRIKNSVRVPTDQKQTAMNQVLAAWHREPAFVNERSLPAEIKIYGRSQSFDCLVKKFGRSVPTRALLDELVRIGAVQLVGNNMVRAKMLLPVERGMNLPAIKMLGSLTKDLLETMLANMREHQSPRFIASVGAQGIKEQSIPLLRKEIMRKSSNYLADLQDMIGEESSGARGVKSASMRVTVFCREVRDTPPPRKGAKRRNLRRN